MATYTLKDIDRKKAYKAWRISGMHYSDFFDGLGIIDEDRGSVGKNWSAFLGQEIRQNRAAPTAWVNTAGAEYQGNMEPGDINADSYLLPEGDEDEHAPTPPMKYDAPRACPEIHDHASLTRKILAWRESQAVEDWRHAELLRQYIRELLASGQSLNVNAINAIANAMERLQKIQRLALGLSSENVGFPLQGVSQGGNQLPIINVVFTPKKVAPANG